jgi:hypothetical protein
MAKDASYMRAFDTMQLGLIRDTFQRWGPAVLPTLKDVIKEDKRILARHLAQLDKDQEYWEQQRARLRGGPLASIARQREDLPRIRAELADMVLLLECEAAVRLSVRQLGHLCEVYTRRDWPRQKARILERLKQAGPAVVSVIRKHIAAERRALPAIEEIIAFGT